MSAPSWFARRHPDSPIGQAVVAESVGAKDWPAASSAVMSDFATRALVALTSEGFFTPADLDTLKSMASADAPFIGDVAEACWSEAKRRADCSLAAETAIHLLFAVAEAEDATKQLSDAACPPDELLFLGMEIASLGELLTITQAGVMEAAAEQRALREAQSLSAHNTNRRRAEGVERRRAWIIEKARSIMENGPPPDGEPRWSYSLLADEVFRDWAPVPANDHHDDEGRPVKRTPHSAIQREVKTAWLNGTLKPPSGR